MPHVGRGGPAKDRPLLSRSPVEERARRSRRPARGCASDPVGLRRLRSLFSAVKKLLPKEERRAVGRLGGLAAPLGRHEFRRCFRRTAGHRCAANAQIARLGRASAAAERARAAPGSPGKFYPRAIPRRCFACCDGSTRAAGECRPSPKHRADAPISRIAPDLLDRRRRRVRQRSRRFKRMTPEERHRLRIAVKKLRTTRSTSCAASIRRAPRAAISNR